MAGQYIEVSAGDVRARLDVEALGGIEAARVELIRHATLSVGCALHRAGAHSIASETFGDYCVHCGVHMNRATGAPSTCGCLHVLWMTVPCEQHEPAYRAGRTELDEMPGAFLEPLAASRKDERA